MKQPGRFVGQARLARIADRDQDVADEAVAADALDRALAEQGPEAGIVEPGQLGKPRRLQCLASEQRLLACRRRELVPGAYGEAVVAAIDAVAHRLAEFGRDRPLVLDGQIRDAAS